jgi:hypothetical protein
MTESADRVLCFAWIQYIDTSLLVCGSEEDGMSCETLLSKAKSLSNFACADVPHVEASE